MYSDKIGSGMPRKTPLNAEGSYSATDHADAAIRRVARPIRPEWPQGTRFFVSPPVLFVFMLLMTALAFLVMFARFHSRMGGL